MTDRLTDEQIKELERLDAWPRPWRTYTSTEGDESDIVADNAAYPDEIAHLAEFADERDARLAVLAVNALPSLIAEILASRAARAESEGTLPVRTARRLSGDDLRDAARRLSPQLAMEDYEDASRDGQGETHRETVEVRPSGLSGFTWKRIALGWWGLYTVGDVHAGDVWDVAENNRRAWEEWEARRAARGVPGAPEPYNADEDVDPFTWHTWDRHGVGGENASARTLDAAMRDVEEALVRQDWHVPGPDEGTGGGL